MTLRGKITLALVLSSPAPIVLAQQSVTPATAPRPRSAYDPAAKAGGSADTTSAVEKAFHAVNPQDKDYGLLLQSVRMAAIDETIHNALWWADVVLLAGFSLSFAGNVWQHRRTEDRLRISSAIVAQLYNSHLASRLKALDAIEKHNQLADLYNAKFDEQGKAKESAEATEQKKIAKGESRRAAEVAEQQNSSHKQEAPASADQDATAPHTPAISVSETQLPAPGQDEMKRLKAALTARDQKISNLRAQLNQAHQRFEEEHKRNPATTNV